MVYLRCESLAELLDEPFVDQPDAFKEQLSLAERQFAADQNMAPHRPKEPQ